jgi:hypothetical protein
MHREQMEHFVFVFLMGPFLPRSSLSKTLQDLSDKLAPRVAVVRPLPSRTALCQIAPDLVALWSRDKRGTAFEESVCSPSQIEEGTIPAHPVDPTAERKEWRFLLSELSAWMRDNSGTKRRM